MLDFTVGAAAAVAWMTAAVAFMVSIQLKMERLTRQAGLL